MVAVGYLHYVTQRGNFRGDIFPDDEDRQTYLHQLAEAADDTQLEVSIRLSFSTPTGKSIPWRRAAGCGLGHGFRLAGALSRSEMALELCLQSGGEVLAAERAGGARGFAQTVQISGETEAQAEDLAPFGCRVSLGLGSVIQPVWREAKSGVGAGGGVVGEQGRASLWTAPKK